MKTEECIRLDDIGVEDTPQHIFLLVGKQQFGSGLVALCGYVSKGISGHPELETCQECLGVLDE